MKRAICVILVVLLCIISAGCADNKGKGESALIRIHIRANSNDAADQAVKLKVRDRVNALLEKKLGSVKYFDEAYRIIERELSGLITAANDVLSENGFSYKASARLTNEFFPTRSYEGVVVESGYYDALILGLGDAAGDNWWCVIYPPLCYVEAAGSGDVHYRSKLKEWWDKIFG